MNIDDVFGFNLKPKEDFGVLPPEEKYVGQSGFGEFVASTDEEHFSSDFYATREEAVKNYPGDIGLEPGDGFLVGRCVPWMPKVNGQALVEGLGEEAADEVGESSHQWLTNISQAQMDDLEDTLTHEFKQWMKRYGHTPHFFKVEDMTDHTVPEPPEEPPLQTFQGILRDFGRRDYE